MGDNEKREARSQLELEKRVYHLKTLHDVCQEIGFLKGTDEILQTLLAMTMGTFGSLEGFALLVNTRDAAVENLASRGIEGDLERDFSAAINSDVARQLRVSDRVEILKMAETEDSRGERALLNALESFGTRIWVPFVVDDETAGGIGLGEKIIGETYSQDDQELLYTLASQGAVSIKNARLVEQMKKEQIVRTNLSRYLSPQFVEKVVSHDMELNLGGDRRKVTVLFSDIRNFTGITESRPPDQLVAVLNEYYTAMANCIFENAGIIDKYIGDAIMATFGSLIEIKDAAASAVRAAIEMMEILPGLNERWAEEYDGFNVQIGIGITTGEVFIGNIGSPERMEYTAIGDTVNVASRFSGIARAGQIIVGSATRRDIGDEFRYKDHPPATVKGKSHKLRVYEILY